MMLMFKFWNYFGKKTFPLRKKNFFLFTRGLSGGEKVIEEDPLADKSKILEKTTYDEFEQILFNLLSSNNKTISLSNFLHGYKRAGVELSDPRLANLSEKVDSIKQSSELKEVEINFDQMKELISSNRILTRQIFISNLIIPEFSSFALKVDELYWNCKKLNEGKVTSNSRVLSGASPHKWAVSICSTDGQQYMAGDSLDPVVIHSCCTPINYVLGVDRLGSEIINEYNPSQRFPTHSLDYTINARVVDPLRMPGSLIACSLLSCSMEVEEIFEKYQQLSGLSGLSVDPSSSSSPFPSSPFTYNQLFFKHEKGANMNVYAHAHTLQSQGAFPAGIDLNKMIDLYLKLRSLEMSPRDLSVVAATLANDGVCPKTDIRVVNSTSVQHVVSRMMSFGISNQFSLNIGIPAVAGISGGLLLVVPGLLGAFLWSPPLDIHNLSFRGLAFCQEFSRLFQLHFFNHKTSNSSFSSLSSHSQEFNSQNISGQFTSLDDSSSYSQIPLSSSSSSLPNPSIFSHVQSFGYPGKPKHDDKQSRIIQTIYSAALGDLASLRSLWLRGHQMDQGDYDLRTALHLAANQGHLNSVKFLVEKCKVNMDAKDIWGSTALEDAIRSNHQDIVEYLTKKKEEA